MKKTFSLLTIALVSLLKTTTVQAQSDELVKVYRWYNTDDKEYVTVAEGEYQEGQMLHWKWTDKEPIFTAYRNPGEGRVAVYGWYNPHTKDHVSIIEDEFSDNAMMKMGYEGKHVQFYASLKRGNNYIPVYRWLRGDHDWVTIPEEGKTDAYFKKGYGRKTFQFYGIQRAADVFIYNQL
ncbi:MAG: hypothetical protein RL624_1019 [Bacteroidota bacterium]|jgi:hypothetical protein